MKNIFYKAGKWSAMLLLVLAAHTAAAHNDGDSTKTKVTETFTATEMGCTTDAKMVEKALYRTKGVKKVAINGENIAITYDPSKVKRETLISVIENTGTCEDPNAKVHKVQIKTD